MPAIHLLLAPRVSSLYSTSLFIEKDLLLQADHLQKIHVLVLHRILRLPPMARPAAQFRAVSMGPNLARTKVHFAGSRNNVPLFGLVDGKNLRLYQTDVLDVTDVRVRCLDFDSGKVLLSTRQYCVHLIDVYKIPWL